MLKQQIISQLLLLVESHLHFMNINTLSKPQPWLLTYLNLIPISTYHTSFFLFVLKHIDGTGNSFLQPSKLQVKFNSK
jgi:hypothetical protein